MLHGLTWNDSAFLQNLSPGYEGAINAEAAHNNARAQEYALPRSAESFRRYPSTSEALVDRHNEIICFIDALTIGHTDNLFHCVPWQMQVTRCNVDLLDDPLRNTFL